MASEPVGDLHCSKASASSGVARGIIPGSLKVVRNSVLTTNINNNIPQTGIDQLTLLPR